MSQAICEATILARHPRAARNPDAELIRLSAEVEAIEADQRRLSATAETIEDELRMEPARVALDGRRNALVDEMEAAIGTGPKSAAGALAIARAALALANRSFDGSVLCENDGEWLAFSVVELFVESATG